MSSGGVRALMGFLETVHREIKVNITKLSFSKTKCMLECLTKVLAFGILH